GALGLTTASEDNDGDGTASPVTTQKQQTPASELPWLNIREKDGSLTELGVTITSAIAAGTETIDSLKQQYRISKTTAEQLSAIKPSSAETPGPISGHWYAKLDKCKSKDDLDKLALDNKETIQANPELKAVFKEYYGALKAGLA
ncbi:MAG: hypothetical protein V4721_14940, partial [Bacteroidota bacterium]